jgi:hypothetical protein
MEDRTVICWDKDDIDAVGMLKIDVLALGMLTCIRKALDLIAATTGRTSTSYAAIPPRTLPTRRSTTCSAGPTLGVFQVESRAQMNFLPRMRPREFYDLVIEVAIVRPGPIQGGMVHPYLRRRNGRGGHRLSPTPRSSAVLGDARRAALPGAGHADRHRRRGLHARPGRPAAPRARHLQGRRQRLPNSATGSSRAWPERLRRRDFAERCFEQIKGFGVRLSREPRRQFSPCWSTPRPG